MPQPSCEMHSGISHRSFAGATVVAAVSDASRPNLIFCWHSCFLPPNEIETMSPVARFNELTRSPLEVVGTVSAPIADEALRVVRAWDPCRFWELSDEAFVSAADEARVSVG